ncbi:hypothetical protein RvY_16870-2 [Ramazzottius varieornatus]|uniref:Uncharacterized protein n=1 Tax=Ramazzottius varieornatus TaxID=947166 RepID=A0A1D1W117_RAMVA|nr:hypothetical protein RvY_16870-2 [Ramazzottius varieornatus]
MASSKPSTPSLSQHRPGKILIAFDFDHTIAEENTDVFVRRLLGPEGLPAEIEAQQRSLGWTKFMGAILQHLHDKGITSNQIRDLMQRTPLTPGMDVLLRYLHEKHHVFDCVIISDANSLFIWWILHFTKLEGVFPLSSIYTNPARIDDTDCKRQSGAWQTSLVGSVSQVTHASNQ